jgi:hypothetical protein
MFGTWMEDFGKKTKEGNNNRPRYIDRYNCTSSLYLEEGLSSAVLQEYTLHHSSPSYTRYLSIMWYTPVLIPEKNRKSSPEMTFTINSFTVLQVTNKKTPIISQ